MTDVRSPLRSQQLTQGRTGPVARAYLRAVGLDDRDFDRPQVAIADSANDVTPCNMHLRGIADEAREGVRGAGAVPLGFSTIAVSDAIAQGHEGMRASLVSREVIADSVELMLHSERMDALVTIAGCDKSLPGMLMACARLDLPAVFVFGGASLPGRVDGREISGQEVFEAIGAVARGAMPSEQLDRIERAACPGAGSCAGMFTASSMAVFAEAIGMSLPGTAAPPAVSAARLRAGRLAGGAVVRLLEAGITARKILTKPAFENALTASIAVGGSTNVVLHSLAIASEAVVELTLADIERVARRTPQIRICAPRAGTS